MRRHCANRHGCTRRRQPLDGDRTRRCERCGAGGQSAHTIGGIRRNVGLGRSQERGRRSELDLGRGRTGPLEARDEAPGPPRHPLQREHQRVPLGCVIVRIVPPVDVVRADQPVGRPPPPGVRNCGILRVEAVSIPIADGRPVPHRARRTPPGPHIHPTAGPDGRGHPSGDAHRHLGVRAGRLPRGA